MYNIFILFILGFLFSNTKLEYNATLGIQRENAITNAIQKNTPAVVGINVIQLRTQSFDPFFDPFFDNFFNKKSRTYKENSQGSGVIISSDGYIITNSHVIENADNILVSTNWGTSYDGLVIGMDELTDIALIKINTDDRFNLCINRYIR